MLVDFAALLFAALHVQDPGGTLAPKDEAHDADDADRLDPEDLDAGDLRSAGWIAGLGLDDREIELMLPSVQETVAGFLRLQRTHLANDVPPAFLFTPLVPGVELRPDHTAPGAFELAAPARPASLEELAWADIPTLAALVKSRRVSCAELVELALARLERLDPKLHCVVTLLPDRARASAKRLDDELARGAWRGLLHGIPWGAKDLIAVRGAPTTWGSPLLRDQMLDLDAAVVGALDAAGAVLVAKLAVGELAMDDQWFGGQTRNPWKLDQGSSGSSAGSASAVAAGCVTFALGTETLGSIVSPSARCGASSLRPTFGRVPRQGVMALSWTMDKVGPLARSLVDCGIVLEHIQGPGSDERDAPSAGAPRFRAPDPAALAGTRVGYLPRAFEEDRDGAAGVLDELRALGVEMVPVEIPAAPAWDLMVILTAEAATAFAELTESGADERMLRQDDPGAWPNTFRAARLIPAVEYLRAARLRTELMRSFDGVMAGIDVFVHPSFGGDVLGITNLTGHPSCIAPAGFREDGTPRSISFTGRLFGEARLIAVASAWQRATGHHRKRPAL